MSRIRLRTGRGTKWLTALLGIALVFGWPPRGADEAAAPSVQIYFPTAQAEVQGVIQIRVRAASPYGIHFIEVYVDDLPRSLGVRNTEPYTFTLNTARFTDGIHIVRALLVDFKGDEQWSDPVAIEIRNTPKPVPAPNPIVPPPAGAHGVIAPPSALPLPVAGAEGVAAPGSAALGRVALPADALRPRSGVAAAALAAPVALQPTSMQPRAAAVVSAAPLGVPSGRVASEPLAPVAARATAGVAGAPSAVRQRLTSTAARPAQSVPAAGASVPATRTTPAPRAPALTAPRAVTTTPAGAPRTSVAPASAKPASVPMVPGPTPAARPAPAQPAAQTPPQSAPAAPSVRAGVHAEATPVTAPAEPVRIASLPPLPAVVRHEPVPPAFEQTGIVFNGRRLTTDVAFHLVGGLALAPLRAVAEASGAVVMWTPSERHAAVYLRGRVIVIAADRDTVLVDGAPVHLAMPPRIVSDRLLVPARFLADLLELRVGYDAASRQLRFRPR